MFLKRDITNACNIVFPLPSTPKPKNLDCPCFEFAFKMITFCKNLGEKSAKTSVMLTSIPEPLKRALKN